MSSVACLNHYPSRHCSRHMQPPPHFLGAVVFHWSAPGKDGILNVDRPVLGAVWVGPPVCVPPNVTDALPSATRIPACVVGRVPPCTSSCASSDAVVPIIREGVRGHDTSDEKRCMTRTVCDTMVHFEGRCNPTVTPRSRDMRIRKK
jgi:hypothetical protein